MLSFTFWAKVIAKVTLDIAKDYNICSSNSILLFAQSIWGFTYFNHSSPNIIRDLPVLVIKSHLSIVLSPRFNLVYLVITPSLLIVLYISSYDKSV